MSFRAFGSKFDSSHFAFLTYARHPKTFKCPVFRFRPQIHRGFCPSCPFSQDCVRKLMSLGFLAIRTLAVLTLLGDFMQFQQPVGRIALRHHFVPEFQEQCILACIFCCYKTV